MTFLLTVNHVNAQVNPGNDPVMWDYVDPTIFWIIMTILVVIVVGFIIYFRMQSQVPKKNDD